MAQSRILLWGLGRENRAYLQYLERTGWDGEVLLYDESSPSSDNGEPLPQFSFNILPVEDVGRALATVELLVRSPGVSPYKPEIQAFLKGRGRVTTSTSLALSALKLQGVRVVGVTGTNGKSSTSTMLGCIFEASDEKYLVAGNIGKPLINYVSNGEDLRDTLIIVELSSYQIFDLDVAPSYVIFLNLFVDHVEWHKTVQNYKKDKLSILYRPGIVSAIVHPDIYANHASSLDYISAFPIPTDSERKNQCLELDGTMIDLTGTQAAASGHMFTNAAAAATMAKILGLSTNTIEKGLRQFQGLAHRLQVIETADGVSFVDDSISTTPESVIAALKSFQDRRIHLILGGYDRGLDYTSMLDALSDFDIGSLILIGDVGTRLSKLLKGEYSSVAPTTIHRSTDLVGSLDDLDLQSGDVVLLSPGAASFDSYRDYIHRGEAFADEVKELLVAKDKHGKPTDTII